MDEEEKQDFKDNIKLVIGSKRINEILPSEYIEQKGINQSPSPKEQSVFAKGQAQPKYDKNEEVRKSSISH